LEGAKPDDTIAFDEVFGVTDSEEQEDMLARMGERPGQPRIYA
jgi:hypothetical protein